MIDYICTALQCIPAHDRDTWIKTGMALKSYFGDDGFSLWDHWSQSADNYNEKDARCVWQSFRDGSTTIMSLFYLARKYGYQYEIQPPKPIIPKKAPPSPQKDTTSYARAIWGRVTDNVITHPYAISKGVTWPAGAGRARASGAIAGKDADCIVVPIRDIQTYEITGIQAINAEGKKQTFGRVSGNALMLGNTLDKSIPWVVIEGWATGVSAVFHQFMGNGVAAIAFGKGNMDRLADRIIEVYQADVCIIEEDDSGN